MVEPKAFQDALLAYHARPCDSEAEAVRAAVLQQVLNFLQHARKPDNRGDEVFRCGFNGALEVVAARIREMQGASGVNGGPDGKA